MSTLDAIPMDPICPRCGGKHGVEETGDGYEHDCAACHQHLICAIGPDGGEMYPWHREDGSCGCEREPHTCDMDEEERAELRRDRYADSDDDDDELDDGRDTSSEEDHSCIADDSTECDCPSCSDAEDRFWAEQGEGGEPR